MVPILPGENDTTATQQWPLGGGGGESPQPQKKKRSPGAEKGYQEMAPKKGPLKRNQTGEERKTGPVSGFRIGDQNRGF